jgi:hypothetical protein
MNSMRVQVRVGTKHAIYFVENETMRGLLIILSELRLSLTKLFEYKAMITEDIEFYLRWGKLQVVQLKLMANNKPMENGFGIWNFYVRYDAHGKGAVDFPVSKVVEEMRKNRHAFSSNLSYKVVLWVNQGALGPPLTTTPTYAVCKLPEDWGSGASKESGPAYVGSYGFEALKVSIYRQ